MTDLNNEGNTQPSENNDVNQNPGYLKSDAPKFDVPVPPEQPQTKQQPVYNYTPPVQDVPPVQQTPYTPPAGQPPKQTDGLGIASMILGILSLICCWVPFLGFLFGIIGLILGLCARRIDGKKSGFAIAGIITSSIGVLLGIFMIIAAILDIGTLDRYSDFDYWYRFEL